MIPSDLLNLSRLRPPTEPGPQAVTPSQAVTELLADLVPGQRVMAEVQAQLPNGTYRALISQREVTLALPFSAKAGDSLELEVVDNSGKLALAVLARPSGEPATSESAATSLSRTGQLIGDLFANTPDDGKTKATPLNANLPISSQPPTEAAILAPLLKDAVSNSGLFYESHQARWFGGEHPQEELLKEPQGKLSPSLHANLALLPSHAEAPQATAPLFTNVADTPAQSVAKGDLGAPAAASSTPQASTSVIATETLPLIRQQLESLSNNTYIWQGQVWPGQDMRWELVEEDGQRPQEGNAEQLSTSWKTRLSLTLPNLGVVDARLGLQGNHLSLQLAAGEDQTRDRLRSAAQQLFGRIEAAGLDMASFAVDKHGLGKE